MIAFTGVSFQLLNSLIKVVTLAEEKGKKDVPKNSSTKFKNSVKERIVLCLCKLRLNLTYRCLSVLFDLNRRSVCDNFIYMIELLSKILKQVIYWPTYEENIDSMPKCFYKFKNVRIVLDCTEIPVEKPNCLKCRLRHYSHYKGFETLKLLLGVAPSGLITLLTYAYGGRASDKAIFNKSGLLEKLEPTRDAVMVDKGFDIAVECAQNFIPLIQPAKLKKKQVQFSKEQVIQTNDIAAARVHVERTIQRFKIFEITSKKRSRTLIPYIDKIFTVIAGIVNLKDPILADDKF